MRLSLVLLLLGIPSTCNAFVPLGAAPSSRTSVPQNLGAASSTSSRTTTTTTRLLLTPSYPALVEKLPSKNVIDVVEQSPNNKVIAADVAASAGVSLSQASKDLSALASVSQGDIAVSSDGELIYSFPPNLSSVLANNSLKFKIQQTFQKIWPSLFYVIRVSFGLVLLASLAAIFSTILFLSSSSQNSEDNRRRDNRGMGGFGGGFGGFWGPRYVYNIMCAYFVVLLYLYVSHFYICTILVVHLISCIIDPTMVATMEEVLKRLMPGIQKKWGFWKVSFRTFLEMAIPMRGWKNDACPWRQT